MAALDGMSSSRGKSPIPAIIRHPVAEDTKPANSGYCDQYIQPIGSCLRNAFYLPLYNRTSPVDFERNQRLAEEIFQKLQDPSRPVDRKIHSIREHFSIRDVEIRLESPTLIRIMTVRLFESKIPIRDKFLRIVLFTFNQNKEEKAGEAAQRWEPKNIRDLSKAPFDILRALKPICFQSLMTMSLGNVVLEELKELSEERNLFPKTLIIDRGLTSIQKVSSQLYSYPWNALLQYAAYKSGWDADPETTLLKFMEKGTETELKKRQVVIIEADCDFYFSEKGKFDSDLHQKIESLQVKVFRAGFYLPFIHPRAHHALALDKLCFNSETQIATNTAQFSTPLHFSQKVKASSLIVDEVFLKGKKEWHNCFYVGGNQDTLSIAMVRSIFPFLKAFIHRGEHA